MKLERSKAAGVLSAVQCRSLGQDSVTGAGGKRGWGVVRATYPKTIHLI